MLLMLTAPLFLAPSLSSAQETLTDSQEIIVWQHTVNGPTEIIMDTLQRAFEITRPEFGNYKIMTSIAMEQGRALAELSKRSEGELDIGHFATTAEREKKAIAIRIPLIQGMLGYRICLIKENNQAKFSGITNKQSFIEKEISIGQHQDWPDTTILRSNGMHVRTTHKYSLLFQQLDKQRFDCFSRGVNEISYEHAQHTEVNTTIEDSLLLHYPFPLFFFVNANRPILAQRLTLGLTRLQDDGTLKALFEHYYKDRLATLHLAERTLIKLENPTLSEKSLKALTLHIEPLLSEKNKD